jgi:hypothetical protein
MPWVKRNLGLVIGGAVALVLLAVAGYYLWSKYQEDQIVTMDLATATQRFQDLLSRPVHPGTENGKVNNIELAKQEVKRIDSFLGELRSRFGKREVATNITNRDFRALLDNTIFELQRTATNLGIGLPQKDYWFTFAPQRTAVDFKSVDVLTHQLLDIKDLVEILYASKIHDLKGVKRVSASSDDNNSTDFFPAEKKALTNDVAILTPYEITFEGFSTELARVLDRIVSAKRCYIIRTVGADKTATEDQQMTFQGGGAPPTRYIPGMRPQPQMMPGPPRIVRPANVLLDENKLRFVVQVDAVRLKEAAQRTGEAQQVAQQN